MRIGVVGAAGRMGRMLVQEIAGHEGAALAGAVERPGSDAIGQDAGTLAGIGAVGVAVGDDPKALFDAADAVIDFTTPDATMTHAVLAVRSNTALVIGTTGLDAAQEQTLADAARTVPMVYAPNMSVGVTLLTALVEQVARTLGPEFDIEVFEIHHRHKVDAPSGTALGLGRAAARGRGVDLDAVSERGRDGHTGARAPGAIGFAALRGGDVVGDHTVTFAGAGERIELTHKAASRQIYSAGAVRAALWLENRAPGLYRMTDVLGL